MTHKRNTRANMTQTVRVAVPLYLPKTLDYLWQGEANAHKYQMVEVAVSGRPYHGMVVDVIEEDKEPKRKYKLKPAQPLEDITLPTPTGKFYEWVSSYNFSFPGEGLRAALQGGKIPPRPVAETVLAATGKSPARLTPTRQKVLDATNNHSYSTQTELAKKAEVSTGVVKSLIEEGCIKAKIAGTKELNIQIKRVNLGTAQAQAAQQISAAMANKSYVPFLLDGVTGSGKTEVYFEAIADLLQQDKTGQVLVLLPEIALTPQWLERFEERFGFTPHIWHSSVSDGKRRHAWWKAYDGSARVVIGARSALFLPFSDLRLIIVDEEHDPSYKQEEGFRYHGRDMAIVRAKLFSCPVVLASATPSLESWHNANDGRYKLLNLPSRYGNATLPEIKVVDMAAQKLKADNFISPVLLKALEETVNNKQQALLFLNRRGFAPLLICRNCAHRVECPSCSACLVVHGAYLQCHHCGLSESYPEVCPKCNKEKSLHPFGPGTRKIMAELRNILPQARCMVVDKDSVATPAQMREVVDKMQKQELDILVGTQMLAKGHDFDHLMLVGVIDADMGLAHGDLRAAERTFQLLTQVSGRAGRREERGNVILQTHTPDHPLFKALKDMDRDRFLALELKGRKATGFPPFGRLVALIISGENENAVIASSKQLAQTLPTEAETQLFGPAPAPLLKLKDQYRYRLLLRTDTPPHELLQRWLLNTKLAKGIRIDVDIDPQSFL